MTTYHLEHRVPRPYETYVLEAITTGFPSPDMVTTAVDVLPTTPRYVITEDRQRGEHPEALLIRVNGELYARTYVSFSYEAVYSSVNDCANFLYAGDITEWEDVYDEVPEPEPEPEPEQPTADVIRITGIDPDFRRAYEVPTIAIRHDHGDNAWYHTRSGSAIGSEYITAWDDIDTGDGDA